MNVFEIRAYTLKQEMGGILQEKDKRGERPIF